LENKKSRIVTGSHRGGRPVNPFGGCETETSKS
jgi:hypothetical protein